MCLYTSYVWTIYIYIWASQVVLMVKNPPANAGDIRATGSIPGSGRSLEEGVATHSSILSWRIPLDRGTWRSIVHRVAKSWIRLKQLSMHTHTMYTYMLPHTTIWHRCSYTLHIIHEHILNVYWHTLYIHRCNQVCMFTLIHVYIDMDNISIHLVGSVLTTLPNI